MKKYHVKKFFRLEYTFIEIWDFYRANFRYFIYYSKYFNFLMREHIREQIDYRVSVMDKECYNKGECKICGCKTIHLQMANKACEGNCYPPMMNKTVWKIFKIGLHGKLDKTNN